MPFFIVNEKDTKLRADAALVPVDDGEMRPGEVVVSNRFGLFSQYTLQCVCPPWEGGDKGELDVLKNIYRVTFELAAKMECDRLSVPFGFPLDHGFAAVDVARAALEVFSTQIREWSTDLAVYLVVSDPEQFRLDEKLEDAVEHYIAQNRPEGYIPIRRGSGSARSQGSIFSTERVLKRALKSVKNEEGLDFGSFLFTQIKQRQLEPNRICRSANLTTRFFTKLAKHTDMSVSREAILGLVLSMHLDANEAGLLLSKAEQEGLGEDDGDLIVRFCLEQGIYDVFTANAIRFQYGESMLGIGG